MIRRLLIFIGGTAIVAGTLCLLSETWQFGYVGSWYSIGLRQAKLWHVWRATPIADGEGCYVDDASGINRAMYGIDSQVRWRDEPVWPWVLGILATVAYSLILPPILRRWTRPAPRWLLAALAASCLLLATLWTTSHLVTVTSDGTCVHLRLEEGTASLIIERAERTGGIPWDTGWNVYSGFPPVRVHVAEYFAWRDGEIILKVPLGVLFVTLIVPTIVLIHRDPRALPGHCKRCGYDLTGNVSGVCPECGRPIGARAEKELPGKT